MTTNTKDIKLKKRISFYLIYFIILFIFFEFAFRSFYAIRYRNVEILIRPSAVLEVYYPGIGNAMADRVEENNGVLDLLILGGSVLHSEWGSIEQELQKQLDSACACKVNIHNLAIPAHTSLDSRIKYELLKDNAYDIILLYHGINELRFNNCPDSVFKDDYSHIEFYSRVHATTCNFSKVSILYIAYNQLKNSILQKIDKEKLLPLKLIQPEWLDQGKEVKTKKSFHDNYTAIIHAARQRNAQVVIPSFAFYVPIGYSFEAFTERKLDYGHYRAAIEMWGKSENIVNGLNTHNQIILECYKENRDSCELFYMDMNERMEKNGSNFGDICHFTEQGSKEFVSLLLPVIRETQFSKTKCIENS